MTARLVLLLSLVLVAVSAWAAPPTKVAYTVAVADIPNKTYRVTVRAEGVTDPAVSFAIPAWTPGWYILTDAYKNLSNTAATGADGATLSVTQPDRLTWRVATGGASTVTFSYDLKATDTGFGFFKPYLDETNGFVPGPAALVYVVDGKNVPSTVTYKVPQGWQIASANDPTSDPATFAAPDYDTLIDQPADLGKFARYDRTIRGVPFSVVIVGAEGMEHRQWVEGTFRISEAGIRVFGTTPFPRYIYHFRFPRRGGMGGGAGLEHLNSTVITLPPSSLREPESLSIVAHEFVHAWIVKRIRPEKLGPFDYTQEVRVKDLWFAEGVTEYYSPRLMVEAGLQGRGFWLAYLSSNIEDLQRNAARKRVTLERASLGAWEGESQGYGGLSYYNKGMLVGLLLDIELRRRTENRVSLDDLVKELMKQAQATGKGFPEGEIERVASRLAKADLTPFFDRALRSTEELPFAETLVHAGLEYGETTEEMPHLGITWDFRGSRRDSLRVAGVEEGGPAATAGLRAGDRILSLDAQPVSAFFGAFFASKEPGEKVTLTYSRGNSSAPRRVTVTLGAREVRSYELRPLSERTPLQDAIFSGISGAAGAAAAKPTGG